MTITAEEKSAVRLSSAQFRVIADIAKREAGLVLVEAKSAMISSRLAKRLRARGLPTLASYCELVQGSQGSDELPFLISALTTNVSHFFREAHHFDMLKNNVLPELFSTQAAKRPIRIWSAGCSNGQELYSIAMTVLDVCPDAAARDVRILGTDIDLKVIEHARRGIYDDNQISGVPDDYLKRYFISNSKPKEAIHEVSQDLRSLVRINHLNLVHQWPIKTQFDVIFCRNVVIYFDEELQERLWQRFSDALRPGGWLFIGHSERVAGDSTRELTSCGLTGYRKGAHQPVASLEGTGN